MAFDGVTIAAVVSELKNTIEDGRINKIAQPEDNELILTIRGKVGNVRLLMSADASLPLIYLTENNKQGPATAPNFCMLLRKHIQNGKITSVTQSGLERIITIKIEHLDEMGDVCHKSLIFELMGKHSNIIFVDEDGTIIDSIKRVSAAISSVREVLPGRKYIEPSDQNKMNILDKGNIAIDKMNQALPAFKAIYMSYSGISPILGQEVCYRAGVDSDKPIISLDNDEKEKITSVLKTLCDEIISQKFRASIIYKGNRPVEYTVTDLDLYNTQGYDAKYFDSVSLMLEKFYYEKNISVHIKQRSSELRHVVATAIERNTKKLDLQLKQLKDTENRDKYRLYGELLTAYAYQISSGIDKATVDNYYNGEQLTIPLDSMLSASENAQKYYEKYNKQKRTYEALSELIKDVQDDILHLQSIQASLDIALSEDDLVQIRQELATSGYIKKKTNSKKEKINSKPFHYISSDGYDIYVGKNNIQNDELTFKFANGGDWWFHAKKIPGSHVVLRSKMGEEIPDRTFEEAAKLAAYYSSGRDQEKIEVDYVLKKEVKKPSKAKPGFVVYYTNYSMATDSDISSLKLV